MFLKIILAMLIRSSSLWGALSSTDFLKTFLPALIFLVVVILLLCYQRFPLMSKAWVIDDSSQLKAPLVICSITGSTFSWLLALLLMGGLRSILFPCGTLFQPLKASLALRTTTTSRRLPHMCLWALRTFSWILSQAASSLPSPH